MAEKLAMTLVLGTGIGAIMALVSTLFVQGVVKFTDYRHGVSDFLGAPWGIFSPYPLFWLLIAASLLVTLRQLLGLPRWAGPADSILAAHNMGNQLDIKMGIGSTLAAFISISGGASVGLYGPLVHFGASVGSFIRRMTGSSMANDVFIGCGVAGAIAAGFNAPLAGIVFAHEAVLRHFSMRSIAPITLSATTAAGLSRWGLGDHHALSITAHPDVLVGLVAPLILGGLLFGLLAVAFMLALRQTARWSSKSGLSSAMLIFMGASACGIIGGFLPQVMGLGTDTIIDLTNSKHGLTLLLLLLLAKILASSFCIGTGVFGGVFSPALFVGAVGGALVASLLSSLGLGVSTPTMVICGMAAVSASVIGAPIAAVLIVLELTTSYEMAVAAAIAVAVCAFLSNMILGQSFFDRQLLDRGIDIRMGRGHLALTQMPISNIMVQDYLSISAQDSVQEVRLRMANAGGTEAYCLDLDGCLLGKAELAHLIAIGADVAIGDHLDRKPLVLSDTASVQSALTKLAQFVGESVPIVHADTGALRGVVFESSLFHAFLDTQNRMTAIERGAL
jgi:CIC family chloride channel protein